MEKAQDTLGELDLKELLDCFGRRERGLIEEIRCVLPELPPHNRIEVDWAIQHAARSVPPLARAVEASPLATGPEQLGGRRRSLESLIERLCDREWLPSDFTIPTGAVLGRSMVLARINFLKALHYSLEPCRNALTTRILDGIQDAIDDGILSQLAEELLTAMVSNSANSYAIRRAAARKLLNLWSDRLHQPVGDFPTVLLSAWKARCKVQAIYGTLLGSDEVLSLLREACEERFVTYFTRDQVTRVEMEAFREFLFGLPYEELQRVQDYMKEKGLPVISPQQVREILGTALSRPRRLRDPSAEEMLVSYYRRRVRAEYRALSSSPGPQKTAEGYMMEAVLRQEIESGQSSL